MTAIGEQFAGDADTTAKGGTISLAPNGSLSLTLNASALGVNGVPLSGWRSIPGGNLLSSANSLIHSNSGWWFIQPSGLPIGGVWATGFTTEPASIPTTSAITYTGAAEGLISEYHIQGGAGVGLALKGLLTLKVDFATRTLSGTITGVVVGSDGSYVTGPVNGLSFTAAITTGTNSYAGDVVAGPPPSGPNTFHAGAKGTVIGQFFGPDASEIGGVLTLSDGTSRLIISFNGN